MMTNQALTVWMYQALMHDGVLLCTKAGLMLMDSRNGAI
jgi:hypothetical protein